MRGIEAALQIYGEVSEGAFAAESLRKLYKEISPKDRVLTATLVYSSLRRQGLWKHLLLKYCKRNARELSPITQNALIIGIAGIVELRYFALPVLINAIVQAVKSNGCERDISLVNAVLHTVADEAKTHLAELKKSGALRDQALYWGVPGWVAAAWAKETSIAEAKTLVRSMGMKTFLSLRLSKDADKDAVLKEYCASGRKAWASPFLERALRTPANPYPLDIPGYAEGLVTPQSESSMFIAEALYKKYSGGPLLDMCCGRGIKTGQIADFIPSARIEAWDISEGRIKAAKSEMERLRVSDKIVFKTGDSLCLTPNETPSAVLLDAPCTGSGTWGRHPEGRWRCTPDVLEKSANTQVQLLDRAVNLVAPGGIILYSTCSTFKDENEKVVASVMANHPDLVEIPIERSHKLMSKGKPYGIVIRPGLPWIDGFYAVMLHKRGSRR